MPLPSAFLASLLARSLHLFSSVSTYHSVYPGAGKSFAIRLAVPENSHYIHVPLFHARETQSKIIQNLTKIGWQDSAQLHLDLYESVQADIEPLLFQLAIFGSIVDEVTGFVVAIPPARVRITFEVPCGDFQQRVSICRLLHSHCIESSEASFSPSRELLERGMGSAFSLTPVNWTGAPWENAFDRLQYVCLALDVLETNKGSFPFNFPQEKHTSIRPERCFQLLLKHNAQQHHVSLWCMWGFVNITYWQLREMHHPESPLNCACMPDPTASSSRDREVKEKLKGELVHFICKTASEFSTRQAAVTNSERVTVLITSMFSAYQYNGLW